MFFCLFKAKKIFTKKEYLVRESENKKENRINLPKNKNWQQKKKEG